MQYVKTINACLIESRENLASCASPIRHQGAASPGYGDRQVALHVLIIMVPK